MDGGYKEYSIGVEMWIDSPNAAILLDISA